MSSSRSSAGRPVGRRRFVGGLAAGAAALGLGALGGLVLTGRTAASERDDGSRQPAEPRGTAPVSASRVVVDGSAATGWKLLAGGEPWYVRGVAYGFPQEEVGQHLDDLAALGVNTLRTYSADPATAAALLDAAAQRGMRVVVGFWAPLGADYREGSADAEELERLLGEVVSTARSLAGHPGVLLWDVGNEVMGMLRDVPDDEKDERRAAYASWVERVAVALHEADPDHPVTSTESSTSMWKYFRDHAPSLDLLAVNAYKAVANVERAWRRDSHDRPYLVTETGAAGDWEVPEDSLDVPREGDDDAKAAEFTAAWDAVVAGGGASLGATVFGYNSGDTYVGMWRYLFVDGDRRPTWYAVQRSLTGAGGQRPVGLRATPPQQTDLRPGQTFSVGFEVLGADPSAVQLDVRLFPYDVIRSGSYAVDGRRALEAAVSSRAGPGRLEVVAPTQPGTWKVYVVAKDGDGSASVAPIAVRVVSDSS